MKLRVTGKFIKGAIYGSNEDCPVARALKAKKYEEVQVGGKTLSFKDGPKKKKYTIVNWQEVWHKVRSGKPFTVNLKFTI